MSHSPVETRTEILFLYDITDANPNGDPNDENRPRIDVETGKAKVSDVRLKRTIRDYLYHYAGHDGKDGNDIFCREKEKADGTIQEGKDRAEDFAGAKKFDSVLAKRAAIQTDVLAKCIDVRMFGATIPVSETKKNEKGSSVTLTGPVQFAMGTSLHKVEPRFVKGTGAFASGQGAQQKTFREEYVLPYALISFYGIVNQQAAKTTKLSSADVEQLFEGIWYGTKNLITRSKIGQRPLLLLLVEYKKEHANSYIGRLDRFLTVTTKDGTRDEVLREVGEITLALGSLKSALEEKKEKIVRLRFAWDERLPLSEKPSQDSNDKGKLSWNFLGLPAEKLELD
jgi:CRISPR-associated protein Csh2